MKLKYVRCWMLIGALAFRIAATNAAETHSIASLFEQAQSGDVRSLESATTTSPAERLLIDARLALARLHLRDAQTLLNRYGALHDGDPDRLRTFYSMMFEASFLDGDYAAAARAGAQWKEVPGSSQHSALATMEQARIVAELLQPVRRQTIGGSVHSGKLAATKDAAGLTRIQVSINGQIDDAVIDTGANLSTVSVSAAKKFGIEVFDGDASVGAAIRKSVDTKVGFARRLEIAGTIFESVAFLVIDDNQLEFDLPSGHYAIHAIIGFPVLRQFGALRFQNHELRVEPHKKTAGSVRGNLSQFDDNLYVESDVGGRCIPLHLDTGSNTTHLTARFAAEHPEVVHSLATRKVTTGEAGGLSSSTAFDWPNVPIVIGDRRSTLAHLLVGAGASEGAVQKLGTLGKDILEERGYIIDFSSMRFELADGDRAENACAQR